MNSSVSALPLPTLSPANEALTLRLPSSLQLKQQLPLTNVLTQQVAAHRQAVRAILNGEDSRMLVIVGPCSIHDPKSALEYASNLARLAADVSDEMLLVMRAYVEKPRTTVGWKGLASDPQLDCRDAVTRTDARNVADGLAGRDRIAATHGRRLLRRSA
jgi:3-deoxy-7-phosphoheptulonate synthase